MARSGDRVTGKAGHRRAFGDELLNSRLPPTLGRGAGRGRGESQGTQCLFLTLSPSTALPPSKGPEPHGAHIAVPHPALTFFPF